MNKLLSAIAIALAVAALSGCAAPAPGSGRTVETVGIVGCALRGCDPDVTYQPPAGQPTWVDTFQRTLDRMAAPQPMIQPLPIYPQACIYGNGIISCQ
jgi:hypothetical protein